MLQGVQQVDDANVPLADDHRVRPGLPHEVLRLRGRAVPADDVERAVPGRVDNGGYLEQLTVGVVAGDDADTGYVEAVVFQVVLEVRLRVVVVVLAVDDHLVASVAQGCGDVGQPQREGVDVRIVIVGDEQNPHLTASRLRLIG